jgi:hypothetical protein
MKRSLVLSMPLVCASLLALYACSSSTTAPPATNTGKDAGTSGTDAGTKCGDAGYACGQPCDPGNSLGVGKFCNALECEGLKAGLCATLGDPANAPPDQQEHFCTFPCTSPDAGGAADECGENATCECQGGQCGCTPNYCLGN